jgi:phenylpyruvate tautomerase PptA (4-oxalocrotonate tautomerase family)
VKLTFLEKLKKKPSKFPVVFAAVEVEDWYVHSQSFQEKRRKT